MSGFGCLCAMSGCRRVDILASRFASPLAKREGLFGAGEVMPRRLRRNDLGQDKLWIWEVV